MSSYYDDDEVDVGSNTMQQQQKQQQQQQQQQQHHSRRMNLRPPQHHQYKPKTSTTTKAPTTSYDLDNPPRITTHTKRRSFPKNKDGSLDSHPDDESETFLNTLMGQRASHRWTSFWWKVRQPFVGIGCTAHRRFIMKNNKIDFTKLALMGLACMAFIFMEYGMTSYNHNHVRHHGDSSSRRGRSTSLKTAAEEASSTKIKGYQARSQIPIPIEYANFVELKEFSDAVLVVRAHRLQQQQQQRQKKKEEEQQQQQQQKKERHRRLDENNNNDNDEEEDEMMNAIEESWKEAKQSNPELKKKEAESTFLLKVNHVPFFWHIPRAGGTTLSTLLATCHSLVQATSSFSSPPLFTRNDDPLVAARFRDPTLYVVRTGGEQFVNVDLDSLEGVQRAVHGELIEKELADVVSVPDVRLGSLLFGDGTNQFHEEGEEGSDDGEDSAAKKKEYKGVLFAMLRHPIDRAVSLFYHKQSVKDSIHYDPSLEIYSLTDWINSPSYITDYMVRTLVGKIGSWQVHTMEPPNDNQPFRPPIPLTHADLDAAKEILRRKCVIGLLEEKGESMKRFEKFFGWNADVHRTSLFLLENEETANAAQAARWKDVKDEECGDRLLHWNWANKNKHPTLDEEASSVAYHLLESKNRYDIELYMYARQLFEEQFIQLGFDDDAVDGQTSP